MRNCCPMVSETGMSRVWEQEGTIGHQATTGRGDTPSAGQTGVWTWAVARGGFSRLPPQLTGHTCSVRP